jgi:hypothetical protein
MATLKLKIRAVLNIQHTLPIVNSDLVEAKLRLLSTHP